MDKDRFDAYEVPDNHAAIMLRMMNMPRESRLPDSVRTEYIKNRIHADRIQLTITERELLLAVRLGYKEPIKEKVKPGVPELWHRGELKQGHTIFVTWRNKPNTKAHLIGVLSDDRIKIRLDGDTEERTVQPSSAYVEQKT